MSPHTATEVVQMGSVDTPGVVSGVIVRNEQVYYAENPGRIMFYVNEYDRVKPGAYICSIQNVSEVEELNRDIAAVEEELTRLQETRRNISEADPVIQRINAQIKNIVDGRLPYFTVLNIPEVYTLKDNISQRINNRNQIIINDNLEVKSDLNSRQQMLLNQLSEHSSTVYATEGGVMVPLVDKMEEVFTFETMGELNREQTLQIIDYNNLALPKNATAGDPIFKIVKSNDWYIAAYVPNGMLDGWDEGDSINLYIDKGGEYIPVSMSIDLINHGYAESYTLFKCTKNIIAFMDMRSVNFKMTDSERNGLKISATALVPRDYYVIPSAYIHTDEEKNSYFVTKQTLAGNTAFPVTVTELNEDNAFIAVHLGQLSFGDVLLGGDTALPMYTVSETVTGQGVYRVNNGVAEYRRVQPDTSISAAGGYIILDPSLSQGIVAYDYIVTDAADVREGQIVQ
jgi:hypothetical protein